MNQEIIDLYDEYTHAPLNRNEFIKRLTVLAGSLTAAMSILPLIEVNAAHAAITAADDLETGYISYPGVNGIMNAYMAKPRADKKYPAVVVIHENRGLNAHIEDVTRPIFGELQFIRNKNRKIPGYHVSLPRARNVRYIPAISGSADRFN